MKILHILSSLDDRSGGPLRAVIDLSSAAMDFGLDSELVGPAPFRASECALPMEKIHVLSRARSPWSFIPDLRQWLAANVSRFDGVVIHGLWLHPGWCAASICSMNSVPYSVFPHGMLDIWPVYGQGIIKATKKWVYWHLLERKVVSGSMCVFYTTKREMVNATSVFKTAAPAAIVVPYGALHSTTSLDIAEVDIAVREKSEGKFALFLGRLHPKKNVEFLLRAWATAAMPPEWTLLIAGEGSAHYKEKLNRIVLELGISRCVSFVGHVGGANKTHLLRSAAWFLLPSSQENFGIAPLEAIGAGCPIAVSPEVYLSEYLHNRSEIIPLEQAEWIDFLRTRMTNPEHRDRIVQLDIKYILPKFEMANVASAWATTLSSFFGRVPRRA